MARSVTAQEFEFKDRRNKKDGLFKYKIITAKPSKSARGAQISIVKGVFRGFLCLRGILGELLIFLGFFRNIVENILANFRENSPFG